jgi:chromosome segregation ATPase
VEPIKEWSGVIATLITIATGIYVFLTAGAKKTATDLDNYKKANSEEIAKLVKALADQDRRLQSLESDMRHLPDREQAHRMEMAIQKLTGATEKLEEQLNGRMNAMDERLKPVAAIGDRLQEYLLEQARK